MCAISYFGYKPKGIQTNNASKFTSIRDILHNSSNGYLCAKLVVIHKLIPPRTPRYNKKVEHSYRIDQESFCNYLAFCSYNDLNAQNKKSTLSL